MNKSNAIAYTKHQLPSQNYNSNFIHSCMTTDPITITHISLAQNPAPFLSIIDFSFTFDVHQPLEIPLEWKVIYVGSAKDESYDQILEEFQIEAGNENQAMKFNVECPSPDFEKIPRKELLSITAIIITVSIKQQEFLRIGYYVHLMPNRELTQQEKTTMTTRQLVGCLTRTILIDKPRITRFKIDCLGQKRGKQSDVEKTPSKQSKQDKIDHSNSLLSISKTSCNEKEFEEVDLSLLPKYSMKKEKKIRKEQTKTSS